MRDNQQDVKQRLQDQGAEIETLRQALARAEAALEEYGERELLLQETLLESERALKEIQSIARLGKWELDLVNNRLVWSDLIYEMFEIDPTKFGATYEAFLETVHPDDRELVHLTYFDSLQTKQDYEVTHRLQMKDGRVKWVKEICRTEFDELGNPLHSWGVVQEVTEQQQMQARLQMQNETLAALYESALEFLSYKEIDRLLQSLVDHATKLFDAPFSAIMSVEGEEMEILASSSARLAPPGERVGREAGRLSWQAVDSRQPVVMDNYHHWEARGASFESMPLYAVVAMPIISGENCVGVLDLGRQVADYPFSQDTIQAGKLFAQVAALALENTQLHMQMREQSIRDPLTGLYNRRYLFEALQQWIPRAVREAYPISFVMLDIDHFKMINDTYGHAAGDQVLMALAEAFKKVMRAGDVVCRYGGDEHIVIMYNTPAATAVERAEQWREMTEALQVEAQGQILKMTISLGVAEFPKHGSTVDGVMRSADRALYRSKENGRNKVSLY